MNISIIVAMTECGRVIGRDGKTPWHIPSDLKNFKTITCGHPVIMGRKTAESILCDLGKPLPGRTNIVLTNNMERANALMLKGFVATGSLDSAVLYAEELYANEENGGDQIFVIGGEQIYKLALPYANKIFMTAVNANVPGDTFFPELSHHDWWRNRADESRIPENGLFFSFYEYTRVQR